MTEEDAREWLIDKFGSMAVERLSTFAAAVIAEAGEQNLVSVTTIPQMWNRHILDSAQLLAHSGAARSWLDIGTGAGFPGMIVALLHAIPITLVEPRRRRADFLRRFAGEAGLGSVSVIAEKVEQVTGRFDIISARAVAQTDALFSSAIHLAQPGTRWLLLKGRTVTGELALAQARWKGLFHVEQSITDENGSLVIAEQVTRR